jgi:hypothetical protein
MLKLSCAALLTIGTLVITSQAKAEDYGPDDTASFIPSCTDHFEACRNSVLMVNNMNMMQMLGGNHGCSFPHTGAKTHADSIAATNAILVWLKAHEKLRAHNTDKAIAQATKALWPQECR